MSVIGRLWRRAPAWRACVVTAVVFTGMAAMFPPVVPHLPPLRWGKGAEAMAGAVTAHFHPQSASAPPDNEAFWHVLPPDTPGQQGIIHYAGRLLPLPAGIWHELVVVRAGAEPSQVALFDRVSNNHLTGLVLVAAPGVMSGATGTVGVPPICHDPDQLAGSVAPVLPGQSPLTHECWAIAPMDMRAVAAAPAEGILPRGLARLGELHVSVPDQMLATTFMRSDDNGWQVARVMLVDHGGPIRKLQDWATRFQVPMHKGYDGTLVAADLPPAVARDPG